MRQHRCAAAHPGDIIIGEHLVDRRPALERELAQVDQERTRLVAAIASGGQLDGLLQALRELETRRKALEADLADARSQRRVRASETDQTRHELLALAGSWRRVLVDDPTRARPIVSSLLKGRVSRRPRCAAGGRYAGTVHSRR